VTLAEFGAQRGEDWRRLQDALARAGGRPERLGPDGVRELGALYRGAAADLAYARRRFPGDPVVARLEALVVAGRGAVYGQTSRGGSVRAFVTRGYWRRLAERPLLILVAWLLLLAPAAAGAVWAAGDPGAALGLVPGELQAAADPPREGRDFDAATASAFSAQVMVNNIQVTLVAFAGGILAGAGTVLALLFNGTILGVVGGLAFGAGNGRRGPAVVAEARNAVELALGTAPWLVLCGLLEGFATGPGLPVAVQLTIGFSLFALFWGLVAWRGANVNGAG